VGLRPRGEARLPDWQSARMGIGVYAEQDPGTHTRPSGGAHLAHFLVIL
jgi:hypothetical protein